MSRKHLSKYNPVETFKLENLFNEAEIKETVIDLDALQYKRRQQDIEFYRYKGFWAWVRGMVLIDDEMLRKACSSDAYIYLLYLKWCSFFFFALSVIGICFLCPFYYQGAQDHARATFLQKITVFEIVYSNWRVWVMFGVSLTYSIVGYRFVYNLVIMFKDFKIDDQETDDDEVNDYAVAKKTILIRNIPPWYSVPYASALLTKVFTERYGREFETVITLGRFQTLYELLKQRIHIATKLNHHMEKLYSQEAKEDDKKHEEGIMKYQTQLRLKNNQILRESEISLQANEGVAFVHFIDADAAEYFIDDFDLFKKQEKVKKELHELEVNKWIIKKAPPANDIVWQHFSNRGYYQKLAIRMFLWLLLIMVSIVFITPLTIIENLNPLVEILEYYLEDFVFVRTYFQFFLTPFCLYLFNYIIVPTLIDFLIRHEKRSRKSHNAKTKLRKNFFFFILNQVMLPLAGFSTIYSFFEYLASQELADWPQMLASKMSPSGSFFLRYIIQVSLISNTFQLLSLPKMFWDFWRTHTWYLAPIKTQQKGAVGDIANFYQKAPFNSDEIIQESKVYFDIAYQQAFVISVFTMIFLFSASVPIIMPFG